MNISELCIRRPVLTTLVTASLIVFGAFSYRLLPVAALPAVDFPTIQITAQLPGASPETIAASVASPIERQLSTISGITSMTSSSALGIAQITIQFDLGRNIDGAALDVQTALATASRLLPVEMTTPPFFRKVNPGDFPVLYISMRSDTMPLSTVNDYAETVVAPQLSQLPGVAQVAIYGAQKFAVRVQVDPIQAAARNISLDDVRNVVAKTNSNTPVGTLTGPKQSVTLTATSAIEHAADYRDVVVAYRNGAPIKLSEIAHVIDSVENNKIATWFNDARAIVLAVQRQPDANTVAVVDMVRERLPAMRAQVPPAIQMQPLFDRSISIRAAVIDVQETLMIAISLVIMVIFLFLRKVSATIIPALAVPVSLVGTCAAMYAFGFSINNMTLLALTLSVGFVVDDAIVMLENIVRHMEEGMPAFEAALKGSREIGFTIISMTLSLAAVFIPVLFMSGILGRLLHEFAVTIMTAVLVSGFVSLTLTPMLASRFVRPPAQTHHGRVYAASQRFFDGMLAFYSRSLRFVLRHRGATMVVSLFVLVATCYLFVAIPKGFFPSEDTGQIFIVTEAGQDISFDSLKEHQLALMRLVAPETNIVDNYTSSVGAGGPTATPNGGRMFLRLKPRSIGRPHVDQIIQRLRVKLNSVPGINAFLQNPPLIRIGGTFSKSLYQFTLQDPDLQELYRWVPVVQTNMAALPCFQDVTTDLLISSPQVFVEIDRDRARALGVTADQIENALYSAYGSRQVSTIYSPINQYWVIMEVLPEYQNDASALSQLYIRSSTGKLAPLQAVANIKRGVGPLTVNHFGQLPSVTVSFNLAPGVSLGTAVDAVNKMLAEIRLPATVTANFQGQAQVFQSSVKGLGILLLMSILVIYIILGILYESFIHPITILSGLPSAGFGALLTLMLFKIDLNLYAFVGLIMLVGIVKKNAIMMVDFAIGARKQGKSPFDAIYQGCLLRFRPIMMTTMAALMGTLPIAFGYGAGGEARQPLGLAVVGGLIVSQLLTLFITPVVYLYLDTFQEWLGRHLPWKRHFVPPVAATQTV